VQGEDKGKTLGAQDQSPTSNLVSPETKKTTHLTFSLVIAGAPKPWSSLSGDYLKKGKLGAAGVHTCNPSYSGGRDQEDQGSKPAWVNSS
jgi:hypothetical protein